MDQYGVFSTTVAIAGTLVLTFSAMIVNMLGRATKWTSMIPDSSPTVPILGARVAGIVLLATTYLKASEENYNFFLVVAGLLALFSVVLIYRFHQLREHHVIEVPIVGRDGKQIVSAKGKSESRLILIGREGDMLAHVRGRWEEAQSVRGESLRTFVAGVGPYDAEAIWGHGYLAKLSTKFMSYLLGIFLSVSVALFIVALVIARQATTSAG